MNDCNVTGSGSSAEDETTEGKMQFHSIMVAWGDLTELERTIKGNPELFNKFVCNVTGERNSRVCTYSRSKK